MKHDIRPHASQPRCYKCGSEDISQLCHHCTVAMCEKHTQPELPWPLRRIAKYNDYKGLGLENSDANPYGAHCDDCLHFNFHLDWWMVVILYASALILFLFSFFLNEPSLIRSILRLSIVGLAGIFFPFWLRNKITHGKHRPKIPLMGTLQRIGVEETIKGSITLDQFGEYNSLMASNSQNGRIIVEAKLNTLDRDRVRRYHRRFPDATHASPLTHLGYLTLKGDTSLRFTRRLIALRNSRPHTIQLVDYLSNNLFLLNHHTHEGVQWRSEINYRYYLGNKGARAHLPIQLYPRVIHHRGNKWALELMIQLTPNEKLEKLLPTKMKVEKLSFQSRNDWEEPEIMSEDAIWRTLSPPTREASDFEIEYSPFELENQEEFPRRKSVYIHFQGGINRATLSPIKGRLEVSFEQAFSGMTGVEFFYPTGFPKELENKPRLKTTIMVDFDLDLRSLNFHRVYAPRIKPIRRDLVEPNLIFVQDVCRRLSAYQCYIQQLIEYPSRTNMANAKKIDRFWRIEGRKYFDLYPIDFQIVVTGFEDFQDQDSSQFDRTQCVLRVNALINGNEMLDRVNQFIIKVYKILDDALRANQKRPPTSPPPLPPPGQPSVDDPTAPQTPSGPPLPPRRLPPNSPVPPRSRPVA